MKTILVILIMIAPLFCFAQTGLSGIVRTEKTNRPMEDCHVYINENLGTVTNENGEFQLVIPEKFTDSELHVTHIGYKPFAIPASDFKNNGTIVMEIAVIMLDEVVVRPDPWMMFQESVEKIISNAQDNSDDHIYLTILNELEKMKSLSEVYSVPVETSNLNK